MVDTKGVLSIALFVAGIVLAISALAIQHWAFVKDENNTQVQAPGLH